MADIPLGSVPVSILNDTDKIIFAEGTEAKQTPYSDMKTDMLGSAVLATTAPKSKEAINELVQDLLEATGYGVVSGGVVTAQSTPNMTVQTTGCTLKTATGARQVVAANAALAVNTADTTNPRKDIVYIDSTGVIQYLQGTAAASPTAPSTPTGGSLLGEIYVTANATTITNSNITDKRKILISTDWLNSQLSELTNQSTIYDNILPFKTKAYKAKGQMHCHTTTSDGLYTPTALLTKYKDAGYDFVSITDHDKLNLSVEVAGIVHIKSSEYFAGANHSHLCAYNINALRTDLNDSMFNVQDSINLIKKRGGLTSFAHAQMDNISLNIDEALSLKNFDMMEVFTAFDGSYYDNYIDNLLKKGKRFNLLAVDDFHNETSNTFNGGWIVVNCDSKNQDNILKEIKAGNYYSSNGNDLNLSLLNGVITANSTSSSNITFITDTDRITSTGTSATYNINGDELYIRVESKRVSDSKYAWSNPIFINKKEDSVIPINMIKTDIDSLTTLQPVTAYSREQLVFVANTNGCTCSISDGIFTINSGTGGTTAGLLFSSYSKKYNGRTIKFSFDIERISGVSNIDASIYYSYGDVTDVTSTTNRVLLYKSNIYSPIKIGSNIDNFIHYEMCVTIPYNVSSVLVQVRTPNLTDNVIYRIKNFKILV